MSAVAVPSTLSIMAILSAVSRKKCKKSTVGSMAR